MCIDTAYTCIYIVILVEQPSASRNLTRSACSWGADTDSTLSLVRTHEKDAPPKARRRAKMNDIWRLQLP